MDANHWHARLQELLAAHDVPGVSLAVLADEEVTTVAAGVLHRGTGVEVTPGSLFQIGSITKVYTATVLMRLVERGRVALDTPVAEVLPEFGIADAETSRRVTLRHLLTHTSGIDGDFFHDTGRGDDCLARYLAACASLRPTHPMDITMSYCNTGYSILGRIIEVLTGMTWDGALSALLLSPLGLTHTKTLPEEVLLFRAALGHQVFPDGGLRPVPVWGMPRSAGPAGTINATAAEVLGFARLHLRGGLAPDGTRLLGEETATAMRKPHVVVPNPAGKGDRWGLGWALFDWDSPGVYGHDGLTIGQMAALRVIPQAGVAIALLANSDQASGLFHQVTSELLRELAGLAVPPPFGPPAEPADPGPAALQRHVGVYQRTGLRYQALIRDGELMLHVNIDDELEPSIAEFDIPLTPLDADLFAGRPAHSPTWLPYRFQQLDDGRTYLHAAGRATPRTA